MQLDKTRVAVRERSFVEILDLALHVLRGHALPIFVFLSVFAIPLAFLNYAGSSFLLSSEPDWYLSPDAWLDGFWSAVGYVLLNVTIVAYELPIATSLVTLYLGESLFVERPSLKKLLGLFAKTLPQLLLFQIIVRACVFMFCFIGVLVAFVMLPFTNEIILLERNPLTARRRSKQHSDEISSTKRALDLHGRNLQTLFARWVTSLILGAQLVASLWITLVLLRDLLVGRMQWVTLADTLGLHWEFPLALWLAVAFFTVVRFLSYLDLRIRREGWEVWLKLHSEADRLARKVA